MNKKYTMFIVDSGGTSYEPYESNHSITVGDHLSQGAETMSACLVSNGLGTNSSIDDNSNTAEPGCCRVTTLAVSNASRTLSCDSYAQIASSELSTCERIEKIDDDIREKSSLHENITDGRRSTLSYAMQVQKDGYYYPIVITDSKALVDILRNENIETVIFAESGIPNGWTCYR